MAAGLYREQGLDVRSRKVLCRSGSNYRTASQIYPHANLLHGTAGRAWLSLSVQRAIATVLLREEVKLVTCAQLSEAGS